MGEKAGGRSTHRAEGGCLSLSHLGARGRTEGAVGTIVFYMLACRFLTPRRHGAAPAHVVWETTSMWDTLPQRLGGGVPEQALQRCWELSALRK